MYRIIKDGETYAYVEEPRYIRQNSNGIFVKTTKDEAQGIALDSTPYNLFGREAMDGVDETVMLSTLDSGSVIYSQQDSLDELILSALEG